MKELENNGRSLKLLQKGSSKYEVKLTSLAFKDGKVLYIDLWNEKDYLTKVFTVEWVC